MHKLGWHIKSEEAELSLLRIKKRGGCASVVCSKICGWYMLMYQFNFTIHLSVSLSHHRLYIQATDVANNLFVFVLSDQLRLLIAIIHFNNGLLTFGLAATPKLQRSGRPRSSSE